jgi:hypothetical protein
MSVQPAPSNTSSIYNSDSYSNENLDGSTTMGLTVEDGKQYFLSFPAAQDMKLFQVEQQLQVVLM